MFASEIKAILTIKGIERRVDLDALDAYLSLRYVPGPKTMFRDIYKLQPGHTMIVQNGTITTPAILGTDLSTKCIATCGRLRKNLRLLSRRYVMTI